MHLEFGTTFELRLALDSPLDVGTANRAYWISMGSKPVAASTISQPFTRGGEFPKLISAKDTQICLAGMATATERPVEDVKELLKQPVDSELCTDIMLSTIVAMRKINPSRRSI